MKEKTQRLPVCAQCGCEVQGIAPNVVTEDGLFCDHMCLAAWNKRQVVKILSRPVV